ncbi:MAG: hypothetical protein EZS28_015784 [Streblomastix strix]|uniref:Uncharacterized protein n=1 Tax=Streblomastix strix TaxID=222440 RepID=A0A5J4W1H8_9EUKA|nr:MAG: hypothetical protein EZS28_015784 [Streblomastix strix]
MIRGDFSGMNKTDLLQLDEGMSNAAYVQFNRRDLNIGFIDSFAFVYFWKKEEAEKLLAKKLIIKNQKHYMISKPQKNTTIAIAPKDIASIIYPDDEYKTLVVDLKSRDKARQMKAYLFEKFKKIQEEFKEQQKRVSWADYELLRSSLHITFDNKVYNYKCDDLTFNEEIVKDAFQQTFITNVDRVELHFHSDGVLKGDGLLFFENTLNGERTVIKALNLSKEMRFVDIGDIRISFEEKADNIKV